MLTRIVAEPATLSRVALEALRVAHFDIGDDGSKLPTDPRALADVPGTLCVAACYRCLMSYYNQPDHELIDRRNVAARELLLRLARSKTTGLGAPAPMATITPPAAAASDPVLARWLQRAAEGGIPQPDADPLVDGEVRLPLVWRAHYVVAVFDGVPAAAAERLKDKAFEVVAFGPDSEWAASFKRRATALGR